MYTDKLFRLEEENDKAESSEKARLAKFLRRRDKELEVEQLWAKKNICPNCHMVLNTTGVCVNDCGYVKPKEVNVGNDRTKKLEDVKARGNIESKTKINPSAIKAEDLQALLDMGFNLQQALEKLAQSAPKVKVVQKPKNVWTYQGDCRCPICGKYSKLHTKGRKGQETMKLACTKHGVMTKEIGGVWKQES